MHASIFDIILKILEIVCFLYCQFKFELIFSRLSLRDSELYKIIIYIFLYIELYKRKYYNIIYFQFTKPFFNFPYMSITLFCKIKIFIFTL